MQLLLVHGLASSPLALFGLAAELRHAGHATHFFGYVPTFESLPRIRRRLAARLRRYADRGRPVGLIGHSLGGLLLRLALADVPELAVHRLVTLGTPVRPMRLGVWAWKWCPPLRWYARGCGRLVVSAEALAALPPVAVPLTAIAGTGGPVGPGSPFGDDPNDGVVAVAETRSNVCEPELFPAAHARLIDEPAVRARILAIMTTG